MAHSSGGGSKVGHGHSAGRGRRPLCTQCGEPIPSWQTAYDRDGTVDCKGTETALCYGCFLWLFPDWVPAPRDDGAPF